jgi:hypothetical protein
LLDDPPLFDPAACFYRPDFRFVLRADDNHLGFVLKFGDRALRNQQRILSDLCTYPNARELASA